MSEIDEAEALLEMGARMVDADTVVRLVQRVRELEGERCFNRLSNAEDEALSLFSEECAESIQVIQKIQRHGLASHNPYDPQKRTNQDLLHKEIGDVIAAMIILQGVGILEIETASNFSQDKLKTVQRWLHSDECKQAAHVAVGTLEPAREAGAKTRGAYERGVADAAACMSALIATWAESGTDPNGECMEQLGGLIAELSDAAKGASDV